MGGFEVREPCVAVCFFRELVKLVEGKTTTVVQERDDGDQMCDVSWAKKKRDLRGLHFTSDPQTL